MLLNTIAASTNAGQKRYVVKKLAATRPASNTILQEKQPLAQN